jgi:hypothetical protein
MTQMTEAQRFMSVALRRLSTAACLILLLLPFLAPWMNEQSFPASLIRSTAYPYVAILAMIVLSVAAAAAESKGASR